MSDDQHTKQLSEDDDFEENSGFEDLLLDDNGLELLGEDYEAVSPTDDSIAVIRAHEKDVFCLALSLDGRWMASGSEDDTTAIWDLEQQSSVPRIRVEGKHVDSINCLAWSANSKILASGDMAGRIICVHLPDEFVNTSSFLHIDDCMTSLDLKKEHQPSPGDDEKEDSFEQLRWLLWHQSTQILFAGCGDGTVWMWLITKQINDQLTIHQSKIFSTNSNAPCVSGKLLSDAKHLVTAYENEFTRIWDLREGKSCELNLADSCSGAMDLNKQAGLIAIGGQNGLTSLVSISHQNPRLIRIFSSPSDEMNQTSNILQKSNNYVECIKFGPEGFSWLAVGTSNGNLSVFDWEHGSIRYKCHRDDYAIICCFWHINSNTASISLISASTDGSIRIWDARNGKPLTLLSGGDDEIFDLCLSQRVNGLYILLSGCSHGMIRVFEFPTDI